MHERITTVQYTPDLEALTRKKRVCAYARVSSDRDEAFHSLSAQISYYQKQIAEHEDWEYVGVFSDRGITGTKEERPGFQAMLTACREGKVDIVLAKSITRFARNTVILLNTVRELKSLGIDIHFEEERIHTLSAQGELMISLLAARAQEESRSASENQKWRIQKCYEKGIPVTGNCLGYRMVDHQFLIDEEEEQIVLRIFSMYLSGKGYTAIAKTLTQEGIKTRNGKTTWSRHAISTILRNEKYTGDLILQKKYVVDHITKKEAENKGEKPKYHVANTHDPIIEKADFNIVQNEIENRAKRVKSIDHSIRYPFSGMVYCGICGKHYKHKINNAGTKYRKPIWICTTFDIYGKTECNSAQVPESILEKKACEVLGTTSVNTDLFQNSISKIVVECNHTLVFFLKDGSQKSVEWQPHSRRESWTPEMREKARQQTKARHEKRRKELENDT